MFWIANLSILVPSFFLKLSLFCVFAADFCCPPCSPGLALNKGHEKRWHLGMAIMLHGGVRHGAMGVCRHGALGVLAIGRWGEWGLALVC